MTEIVDFNSVKFYKIIQIDNILSDIILNENQDNK